MQQYVVFIPSMGDSEVSTVLPESRYKLTDNVWIIGSAIRTPAELCEKLGIGGAGSKYPSGVVVAIGNYYGYFDQALWQRMDNWGATE